MTQSVDLANAINSFVKGCKTDGTWDAIKACCIMAAWDGLDGALYPLKGPAPTNNNFVSGDYNRETGLTQLPGDGKYLDTNQISDSTPDESHHFSVYRTAGNLTTQGQTLLKADDNNCMFISNSSVRFAIRFNPSQVTNGSFGGPMLIGASRNGATAVVFRKSNTNYNYSKTLTGGSSSTYLFLGGSGGIGQTQSFYSIGESIDLALLDNRVSTLMTDIGAAIP